MKFYFPLRSVFVFSIWFILIASAISSFLFIFFSSGWTVWLISGILFLFFTLFLFFKIKYSYVALNSTEISLQTGVLWQTMKRIPYKEITGYSRFKTPLQSLFSISSIAIFAPGSMLFILGLNSKDIDTLSLLLMKEEPLL